MTWLQDPYRMLKKENDLRAAFLSGADRELLAQMFRYLESCTCRQYELELSRKELIGMALQAQAEGDTLAARIPDVPAFCDTLRADLGFGSWKDVVASFGISNLLVMLFIVWDPAHASPYRYTLELDIAGALMLVLYVPAMHLFLRWSMGRFSYAACRNRFSPRMLLGLTGFAGWTLLYLLLYRAAGRVILLSAPWWAPAVLCGLLAALLYLFTVRHHQAQARRRPWQDHPAA